MHWWVSTSSGNISNVFAKIWKKYCRYIYIAYSFNMRNFIIFKRKFPTNFDLKTIWITFIFQYYHSYYSCNNF